MSTTSKESSQGLRSCLESHLVAELARCEFIDKRENVLLVGNPGTGKSHLATALAAAACHKGYKVRFFRTTELVERPASSDVCLSPGHRRQWFRVASAAQEPLDICRTT